MNVCEQCDCFKSHDFDIVMAFQPIVDITTGKVHCYEALVRGKNGEGAGQVLSRVNEDNKYAFDQLCRITAIETLSKLSNSAKVSINFMPNAIYDPQTCLARTLKAAEKYGVDKSRITFEVTEHEKVNNHKKLLDIFETYSRNGFSTAIDDFGEGFAGLNLLSKFQPDILKLDMSLIQGVAEDTAKQAIVEGVKLMADKLSIRLVAEGIETLADYQFLKSCGITLMQGYLFAAPQIETLPEVSLPIQ
ncbi:EAL domain-containing protein [Pseudoalteromonas sp. T1lg65]|uniref:EAL domain-containing protein n=1 Tax=Pseudoalteromonas sp. T1lg65 TaxID=2077101 RepID=UPI003F7AA6B9